ncbi:hypothetical protein F4861DRAFT_528242 [Xylaria intraflava]|nr:hypothetical protein F4861DRAFT_528242 [Xylaria intraflava]
MEQRDSVDGDSKERKWKGKAKEDPGTPSSIPPPDSNSVNATQPGSHSESVLSRLATSGISLTTSIMASGNHRQHSGSILPPSKGESSGASQRSGTALQETAHITHTPFSNVQPELGTTFKSTNSHARGGFGDDDFSAFLQTANKTSGEPGTINLVQGSSPRVPLATTPAMADGSKVVELLETGLIDEDYDYGSDPKTEELSTLKKALFGEKSSTRIDWDDALNFVPDFISNGNSSEASRQLTQHLGVSDATEARDIWLTQWGDVLSSYMDEVWGDLRPLVTTARQELQRISTNPDGATTHGLNAVRRLQQILSHIRNSRAEVPIK